ncbi:MAG: hypoxanthine phosphoribosyltransferase [Bacteroidota bacterium]
METVKLHDKTFKTSIPFAEIETSVIQLAQQINADYQGRKPLFLAVLNGSFMFAADLMKHICVDCEISFIKVASYHGVSSAGTVSELIGLTENIQNRDVIILEDIVDSGLTLEKVVGLINARKPSSVKVAALLLKPEAYKKSIPVDYVAFKIPNDFIVGYGLDYDGLGRNLKNIYKIEN